MWSCRPGSLCLATGGRERPGVSFSAPDCEGKECGFGNQLVFKGRRELGLFDSLPLTPPLSSSGDRACSAAASGVCGMGEEGQVLYTGL